MSAWMAAAAACEAQRQTDRHTVNFRLMRAGANVLVPFGIADTGRVQSGLKRPARDGQRLPGDLVPVNGRIAGHAPEPGPPRTKMILESAGSAPAGACTSAWASASTGTSSALTGSSSAGAAVETMGAASGALWSVGSAVSMALATFSNTAAGVFVAEMVAHLPVHSCSLLALPLGWWGA